jgi:hypothetical protein
VKPIVYPVLLVCVCLIGCAERSQPSKLVHLESPEDRRWGFSSKSGEFTLNIRPVTRYLLPGSPFDFDVEIFPMNQDDSELPASIGTRLLLESNGREVLVNVHRVTMKPIPGSSVYSGTVRHAFGNFNHTRPEDWQTGRYTVEITCETTRTGKMTVSDLPLIIGIPHGIPHVDDEPGQ